MRARGDTMRTNVVAIEERPRVMIADDHVLILDAISKILEPEFDVVGVVTDGKALAESALSIKPDIIVIDLGMPHMNGLDVCSLMKQQLPSTKLVILTMNEDSDLAAEAIRRGASAYVLKKSAATALLSAMRCALKDELYLSPQIQPLEKTHADKHQLTARQREVVQMLAEGMSMKEVATVLNVTPRTVAFHKYRIMELLGLETNHDLTRYAIKAGLIEAL
jgi:DNA-binding NarL/FixJ family response regulator